MAYRLKQGVENFQVVSGKFAGRKFTRGKAYKEIPTEEARKFEKIKQPAPSKNGAKPAKGVSDA